MSQGRPIVLRAALRLCAALRNELEPACEEGKFEFAGSVRRRHPTVCDIEIVTIPKIIESPGAQTTLFGKAKVVRVNVLWQALDKLARADRLYPLKPGGKPGEKDPKWPEKRFAGSKLFKLLLIRPRMQVDIWMPTIETWGAILALRTGPKAFSQALVTRWHDMTKGHFTDGRLVRGSSEVLSTPEERDVFDALDLPWIEPEERASSKIVTMKPAEASVEAELAMVEPVEAYGKELGDYLEAARQRLGGLPVRDILTSPDDWRVFQAWWAENIPPAVAKQAITEVFSRVARKLWAVMRGGAPPNLRAAYFSPAVRELWKERQRLVETDPEQLAKLKAWKERT